MLQVWIQKYDEEMGAAEATYQEELAQTNQVTLRLVEAEVHLVVSILGQLGVSPVRLDCMLQGMPFRLYSHLCINECAHHTPAAMLLW